MIADMEPAAGGGDGDVGESLQRISAQLDGITAKLPEMERRESGLVFWGRIATVVVVAALVVAYVLGYLAWRHGEQRSDAQTTRIAALERQNAANTRADCIAGNQIRAEDKQAEKDLIEYVRITGTDPASPAGRAEAARILARFQVKDRPRPCPR